MTNRSPERQAAAFIARYNPEVARVARRARGKIRKLLPGAVELVYDNYNALVFAFGPSERASELILSIALYPRWVSLFFARGAHLADPHKLLRGSGTRIRHIVLEEAAMLDNAPILSLIREAVATHTWRLPRSGGRTVIQSVSAKQRPRKPAGRGKKHQPRGTRRHAAATKASLGRKPSAPEA
jgi:hypothetical protein